MPLYIIIILYPLIIITITIKDYTTKLCSVYVIIIKNNKNILYWMFCSVHCSANFAIIFSMILYIIYRFYIIYLYMYTFIWIQCTHTNIYIYIFNVVHECWTSAKQEHQILVKENNI